MRDWLIRANGSVALKGSPSESRRHSLASGERSSGAHRTWRAASRERWSHVSGSKIRLGERPESAGWPTNVGLGCAAPAVCEVRHGAAPEGSPRDRLAYVFGKLNITSPRLYRCACENAARGKFLAIGGGLIGANYARAAVSANEVGFAHVLRHDR
jgi:hypothetical protein